MNLSTKFEYSMFKTLANRAARSNNDDGIADDTDTDTS